MVQLVFQPDREERVAVEIGRGCLRIGRDAANDVVLQHEAVSAFHAEIHGRDDGSVVLVDVGSTHGTFVNDQQVREAVLQPGDRLIFAWVTAEVEEGPGGLPPNWNAQMASLAQAVRSVTVSRPAQG